jgi:hypothetical protein
LLREPKAFTLGWRVESLPTMSLVENERAKLSATYLNGLAIAVMAVGGFAPLISFPFSEDGRSLWTTVLVVVICMAVSTALHFIARRALAGLKE